MHYPLPSNLRYFVTIISLVIKVYWWKYYNFQPQEKRAAARKHLDLRKRKALSTLFRELKNMGMISSITPNFSFSTFLLEKGSFW